MGQFLDYIAQVFTINKQVEPKNKPSHVTFAENSPFAQLSFTSSGKSDSEAKIASLSRTNRNTIYFYQSLGALAFIAHLSLVTWPKIQLDTFDLLQSDGWQLITLSLVPLIVYWSSISAMNEINKPISQGTRLTDKNSGLNLNNNDFILSLKIVVLLTALSQISSIYSDQFIWSSVVIVPLWCYQLTSKVAQSEYKRFAPSPRKQWVKLNIARSPKKNPSTPSKQQPKVAKQENDSEVRATPRTRTKRAVKNIITGVSDKYHAFEQNVAHQLSQKIFTPLSPKPKAIES